MNESYCYRVNRTTKVIMAVHMHYLVHVEGFVLFNRIKVWNFMFSVFCCGVMAIHGSQRGYSPKSQPLPPAWSLVITHLVDGEEVSALGPIGVIPFQTLVHVCFTLPELARKAPVDRQRRARQGETRLRQG